ncbi:MAG TPA: molybdopterin-synthase adenylyltransferase MoeB [Gammaproteobacteria bacterium]|nr:molybdopterin-synthase adenylyltransferase MoeB [Gammaproteobacteria bacterium]
MASPPDDQLRYSRQLVLPDFGADAQRRLAGARVLVVGLGGLGVPAATYLAAAGVGTLALSDFDAVDVTNLQRQPLYRESDVGRRKSETACANLRAVNSSVLLLPLDGRLQEEALLAEVRAADVVIDASDNFGTRFALNEACVRARRPLVSGAAIRYEGHVTVFDTARPESPCYACLYAEDAEGVEDCRSNGVLGPLVGAIGSILAAETIKLLTGIGVPLIGRLLVYDARGGATRVVTFARDPACRVCTVRP